MDPERWKQIDNLFQSALAVPVGALDAFLRQTCGTDPVLEREIRSLLESHRSSTGFLESPAIQVAAQAIAFPDTHTIADILAGQSIAHYRLLRRIGSGGMGVVYEAEDIRLGRHVAIKLLLETYE